jgi:hypothetical protein
MRFRSAMSAVATAPTAPMAPQGRRDPRSRARRVLGVAVALAALAGSSGCVAAVVGGAALAGGAAYMRGDLESGFDVPLPDAWAAAQSALEEDLEFAIDQRSKDAVYASVVAYTSNDRRVEVSLQRIDEQFTAVRIRVALFGDEALSRLVLQKMEERIAQGGRPSDLPAVGAPGPRAIDREPVLLEER